MPNSCKGKVVHRATISKILILRTINRSCCPDDVKTALLGLQSVDDCAVSRTKDAGAAGQHVWSVTFLQVFLDRWKDIAVLEGKCGESPTNSKAL